MYGIDEIPHGVSIYPSIRLSIYLSIDLLLVALIIRAGSSKFGSSEAVGWPVSQRQSSWKSSRNCPRIVRKSSKIDPGGGQNRPNCRPESVQVQVCSPSGQQIRFFRFLDRFWWISGGVLGTKIDEKSTKIDSEKR